MADEVAPNLESGDVHWLFSGPKINAIDALDHSPDDASRAVQLAQATDTDPNLVYTNLDDYERQAKATASNGIIDQNHYIRRFLTDPIAAKLTNDDLANLDNFSQVVDQHKSKQIIGEAARGFVEGFNVDEGYVGSQLSLEDIQNHPLASATVAGLGDLVELPLKLFSGLITGGVRGSQALARQLGLSEDDVTKHGDEVLHTLGDPGLMASLGPLGTEVGATMQRAQAQAELKRAAITIEPWLAKGAIPPVGVDPAIDAFHVKEAASGQEALRDALKAMNATNLRERSPEFAAKFVSEVVQGDIEISRDAVGKLYGDKPPEPEDGLLGWVPDIAQQLKGTGDIRVPLADYLGKVDPKVAKELEDGVRVRPEGLTPEEAKEGAFIEAYHGSPHEFEAFANENIGTGEGAATYGHGHYVAEHPEVAGSYAKRLAGDKEGNQYQVRIHRSPDEFLDWDKPLSEQTPHVQERTRAFLQEALAKQQAAIEARLAKGQKILTDKAPELDSLIGEQIYRRHGLPAFDNIEMGRKASKALRDVGIPGIKYLDRGSRPKADKPNIQFQAGKYNVHDEFGAFMGAFDSLEEAKVHAEQAPKPTRNYVVFDPKDLEVISRNGEALRSLRRAAALEPTKGKSFSLDLAESTPEGRHAFDIKDAEGKSIGELYIAEEDGGKRLYIDDIRSVEGSQSIGPRAIRRAAKQLFAQFPNAEELRGMRVSGAQEKANEKYSDMVLRREQVEKAEPAFDGAAPGLTKAQTEKYQSLIAKRLDEDREFLRKQEEKLAQRQASKEYKARKNELRGQVAEEIGARSDVDLEDRLRRGLRLDPESLTEAQRASVPKEWLAEGGLRADDLIASYSADAGLLERASALATQRAESKMGPIPFRRALVEAETESRALAETRKVALDDIWDHVVSETQEEILHEQTMALAEQAGEAYPIKPDAVREAVLDEVRATPARVAGEARYLAEAGRAGRKLEDAALAGDIAEQFRQSQAQQIAFIKARYAKEFAKTVSETEGLVKKYSKREVKGTLPEYTNAIHSILQKIGGKIGRRAEDLAAEMGALGHTDLPDFLAKKEAEYAVMQLQIPVADFLLDPAFKKDLKDLTVGEVQGLHQSLKSLDHLGRNESKLEMAGAKYEREELIEQMGAQLAEKFDGAAKPMGGKSLAIRFLRQMTAATHAIDTVFRRFDGRNPEGIFTQFFVYPGARAMNGENILQRELAGRYREIGKVDRPKEVLEHDFVDPVFEGKRKITRANFDNIIANIGNKYNRERAAYTLGIELEELMAWVEKNASPEEIARAQKRGDSIWSWLKGQDDNVYRNLYGVAPENIVLDGFSMYGKDYDGWYHPIIVDRERSTRSSKFERDPITKPTNFWPSVRNSFTKRRTGSIDNLSFEPGLPELVMAQMVHDISLREYVNDASKVILNDSFRKSVTKNYGQEYHDIMRQWIYNVAGNRSFNEDAITTGAKVSNFFRQNVISTYIAFNIAGTVFKHAPTAAIMSMKEASAANFLKNSFRTYFGSEVKPEEYGANFLSTYGKDPALGESIWAFTRKYSEEIQRRDRHYQDTVTGAHDIVFGKPTLRNKIMEWGAKAVSLSDMMSAVPLWFTKYQDVLHESGDHATAVQRADLAVRNAHGSTSEMSRPLIAANNSALAPWFTSLYGFFGANMQRKIELMHDVNDMYHLRQEKGINEAAKMMPGIIASTLAYVIAPVAVEEAVTAQFTDDKRGFGHHALNWTLLALTNSIVGLRDFAFGVEHGAEPSAGLITSPLHDAAQLFRDVGKPRPMGARNAGKLVQDGLTLFGDATGMMPKPIARAARFGIDVANRQQQPRTAGDYWRGVMSGQAKRRVEK